MQTIHCTTTRAALVALAVMALAGCSTTPDGAEKGMTHDIAELATQALTAGDDGLKARRQLDDLANWERQVVDLSPAGPVIAAALAGTDDDVRHRAVDVVRRAASHTMRGVSVDFLGKAMPAHVTRPFYASMLPAIATASGTGSSAQRVAVFESFPGIAGSLGPGVDRVGFEALVAAAKTAAASDDPVVAAAGASAAAQLATIAPK